MTITEAKETVFKNHIKDFKNIKRQYSKLEKKQLVKLYCEKVARTNSVDTLTKSEIAEVLTQREMEYKYSSEIRELRK